MSDWPQAEGGYSSPVMLRQAREAAGLHIAALAAALKVPVRKLEALEAGRYDELPDLTFARALASSACRHLKIDPAGVLAQIPSGRTQALDAPPGAINAPFRSGESAPAMSALGWLRRPAVLASLILVLAALGLLFVPDLDETVQSVRSAIAGLTAADTAPSTKVDPVLPPALVNETPSAAGAGGQDAAGATAAAPALVANAAVAPPVAADVTPPTAAVPASADAPGPDVNSSALLNIRANADSWIEVVDGTGKTQVQRMLKAGDALDFSASPPYAVVVGRADAVTVTVRGRPFDVSPFARNSVARFQVK